MNDTSVCPSPATGAADRVELRVRPEVAAFALLMERELRANDHKLGWKGDDAGSLADRVVQESAELHEVAYSYEIACLSPVPEPMKSRVASEAADVANMAMMVADVCGCLDLSALKPSSGAGAAGLSPALGRRAHVLIEALELEIVDDVVSEREERSVATIVARQYLDDYVAGLEATIACQADDLERLRKLDEALAGLRALSERATPGPWFNIRPDLVNGADQYPVAECRMPDIPHRHFTVWAPNATLIVAAVNFVRTLLKDISHD